jgi:hypothetical protein
MPGKTKKKLIKLQRSKKFELRKMGKILRKPQELNPK